MLSSRFSATAVRTEEHAYNSKVLSLKKILALKKRVPIEVLTLLLKNGSILYSFFILIILISYADIELNSGPILLFAEANAKCNADKNRLKIFQLSCQSIVTKRRTSNAIVEELPNNTIFCFTETWLTSNDPYDFYKPKKDQYVCFTFESAKKGISKKSGCVMRLILKLRKDLNKFSVHFESICADLKINNWKTQTSTILFYFTYSF